MKLRGDYMKGYIKSVVSIVIVGSMCIGLTGCSKDARDCKKNGKEFIEAALEVDFDDMEDYVVDEDMVQAMEYAYDQTDSQITDIMEDFFEYATVRVDSVDVGKKRITVTYIITIPDPDEVADLRAECESVPDAIEEVSDTVDYEVELEFVNKHDEWQIDNVDQFYDDFYGELYDFASRYAAVSAALDAIG